MRIRASTHATLQELAKSSGRPMQEILAEAVETYSRRSLLERSNEAYAALRGDPERWAQEVAERAEWEVTLADGLDPAEEG